MSSAPLRKAVGGQEAVLAFMGDPASYDPAPEKIERIATHAAVVFLAGGYAYKIKRAVRLPYLDFSTLEKRRAMCERELAVNGAFTPHIYLGVVPIVRRADGGLAVGGPGEPVEWAVKMRRFAQEDLLDGRADRGALPLELMAPLARRIAESHAAARRARRPGYAGAKFQLRRGESDSVRALGEVIASVTAALMGASRYLDARAARSFARDLKRQFDRHASLLREREARGYVRRCHGDLHLRNIVLIEGEPALFDAIEFDERIATIDIFYDLAFLLMDLWHRGLSGHANAVFNAYLQQMRFEAPVGALEGLALLPMFLAARAGVRAMVAHDRLRVTGGADADEARTELAEFFALARSFLRPGRPRLVAVGGLSGTGKSTLAAALAAQIGAAPGALVVRSDIERKRLAGVASTARLGPEHYSPAATGRVYRILNAKAQTALAAGHAVILDAVFAREDERARAEALAKQAGVPFTGLWLEAPADTLIERVSARTRDASDADARVVRTQLGYDTGAVRWTCIDAGGSPEDVLARAAKAFA